MKDKLIKLLDNSYCPYSNFRVSAIVVMKDGKEFSGVNVEDASTRAGACAERVAIFSAITSGYKKNDFREIHVLCGDSNKLSTPCFVCRQLLTEFFNYNDLIYVYNNKGESKAFTIKELCPYPFNEEDLI